MDQSKRLVVNTVSNVAVLVAQATLGFFLAPYILNHLGESAYGVWALTASLLAYSNLLSLGLNSAVNRWVPMYLVEKNFEGINRVVNTTLFAYLVAGAFMVPTVVVLALGFPYWFDPPPELHTASSLAVALVGVGVIVLVILNVFSAVLSGLQRYELMAVSDLASDLGSALAVIAVLSSGLGLVALATVSAVAATVRNLLKSFLAKRNFPELRIDLSLAQWRTFRDMLGYSLNTLLYSCGQLIQRQAALILIGVVFGTAAVTEYVMPLLIVGVVTQLVVRGSAAIKPAATHLDTEEKTERVQRLYLLGTKYALLIILPIAAILLTYAEDVMRIWLKAGYMESGPAILSILIVGAALRLWHMPAFFVVVGLGKHRVFGLITLVTAVSSLLLGGILAVGFKMGVLGVAIGFAVPDVVFAIFLIPPYCCRCVGLTVRKEISDSLMPAILGTLPLVAALAFARRHFQPSTLLELAALCAALAIPILLGWWWFGFSASEKLQFARILPLGGLRNRRKS